MVFDLDKGKIIFFCFSWFSAFKQAKEHILLQVQPLQMLNSHFVVADFREQSTFSEVHAPSLKQYCTVLGINSYFPRYSNFDKCLQCVFQCELLDLGPITIWHSNEICAIIFSQKSLHPSVKDLGIFPCSVWMGVTEPSWYKNKWSWLDHLNQMMIRLRFDPLLYREDQVAGNPRTISDLSTHQPSQASVLLNHQ